MKITCFSLASALALLMARPAYAMATPGNATPSDADMTLADAVFSVSPRSQIVDVVNTVDYSGVSFVVEYYNMSNEIHHYEVKCDSNGRVFLQRPADFASMTYCFIGVGPNALPPAGNYTMAIDFASDTGMDYSWGAMAVYHKTTNATLEGTVLENTGFRHISGDWTCSFTLNTTGISDMHYRFQPTVTTPSFFPFGGYLKVNFTSYSGTPTYSPYASRYSSDNVQQDISSGVSNISSGISNISSGISDMASAIEDLPSASEIGAAVASAMEPHYNNILTQLHHITEQLHAFWDQLAAYFNDRLIPQMVEDTDRIVEAIESMDIAVDISMDKLISALDKNHQEQLANDNKNHQEQIANDNKNADEIMNSYDNSSMDQTNDKLKDSLDEYDQAESELIGSVQDNITNFEYTNPFERFTAPLADISFFLTGIYNGIGNMNLAVAFSLTLSIALICIGWYRFRGG